jgi:hypothetical protein
MPKAFRIVIVGRANGGKKLRLRHAKFFAKQLSTLANA